MNKRLFLILSFLIFLISIYANYSIKDKYLEQKQILKEYKKLSLTYDSLNRYNNLSKIKGFHYKKNKNKIEFTSNNLNKIDRFVNKILNSYIFVKYFKLEKNKVILKLDR